MNANNPALPRHIRTMSVEGVLGVGKTSLCRILSKRMDAQLICEEGEENPFLPKFYKNRKTYAFQTQLWFLLSRYRQLTETFLQLDLFHDVSIFDYMFAKDRIFATVNLDENELSLYNHIVAILEERIPSPDYVVYLQASTDVLLRRIEKRGRPFESNIDWDYLDQLNQAYNHFFFHYTDTPLLIINTNDIDFVQNDADREELLHEICKAQAGSHFYQPLDSNAKNVLKNRIKPGKDPMP
jgi:deoxyadenosine/deoxycytidine kinase